MELTVADLRRYEGSQVSIRTTDGRELIGLLKGVELESSNGYGAHCRLIFEWLVSAAVGKGDWVDEDPYYKIFTGYFHATRIQGDLVLCPAKSPDLILFLGSTSEEIFDYKERRRAPRGTRADINPESADDAA